MGVIIVALLAEGVDRNIDNGVKQLYNVESPSSRRAWIEIKKSAAKTAPVDSRPPRGGRG